VDVPQQSQSADAPSFGCPDTAPDYLLAGSYSSCKPVHCGSIGKALCCTMADDDTPQKQTVCLVTGMVISG
jgi:hypothetical protein